MEDLNNVPSTGTFGNSINQVNQNFGLVKGAIENLEGRTIRSKGLFPTQAALTAAYPSPKVGDYAYVGSGLPATIYDCLVEGTWHNTGQTGGSETIDLGAYSTTAQMNTAIDNGLQGQVGYAVCNSNGSDRKDVVVNGFKLLASGGALHIKMTNANTAANAKMNISPTSTVVAANTKPLFYNGAQASATNTWGANEIISVYYDGTNYQATNSQGGGGKAEKIKYDNSTSGLAAKNVQEALTELAQDIVYIEPAMTSGNGVLFNNWSYNTSYTRTHFIIRPTNDNRYIKITSNQTLRACIGFLKSYTSPSTDHQPADFCNGYSGAVRVPVGESKVLAIPFDCNYIIINRVSNGASENVDYTPAYIGIDAGKNEMYDDVKDAIPFIDAQLGAPHNGVLFSKWGFSEQYTRSHQVISINDEKYIKVTANPTNNTHLGFLKSYTEPTSASDPVDFCDGHFSTVLVPPSETKVLRIPSDCNYIVVDRYNNSAGSTVYMVPDSIQLSTDAQYIIDNLSQPKEVSQYIVSRISTGAWEIANQYKLETGNVYKVKITGNPVPLSSYANTLWAVLSLNVQGENGSSRPSGQITIKTFLIDETIPAEGWESDYFTVTSDTLVYLSYIYRITSGTISITIYKCAGEFQNTLMKVGKNTNAINDILTGEETIMPMRMTSDFTSRHFVALTEGFSIENGYGGCCYIKNSGSTYTDGIIGILGEPTEEFEQRFTFRNMTDTNSQISVVVVTEDGEHIVTNNSGSAFARQWYVDGSASNMIFPNTISVKVSEGQLTISLVGAEKKTFVTDSSVVKSVYLKIKINNTADCIIDKYVNNGYTTHLRTHPEAYHVPHPMDVYGNKLYVAFYSMDGYISSTQNGYLAIYSRDFLTGEINISQKTVMRKGDDHEWIAMIIDNDGCMHIMCNCHATPLNYLYGDVSDIDDIAISDKLEWDTATYPDFIKNGENLYAIFRDKASYGGRWKVYQYDYSTKAYSATTTEWVCDGTNNGQATQADNTACPYWQQWTMDKESGWYYNAFCWRSNTDVTSNHDICFIKTQDFVTFYNYKNEELTLPITLVGRTVCLIKNIGKNKHLYNQVGIKTVVVNGEPVVIYATDDSEGNTNLFMMSFDGDKRIERQITHYIGNAYIALHTSHIRVPGFVTILIRTSDWSRSIFIGKDLSVYDSELVDKNIIYSDGRIARVQDEDWRIYAKFEGYNVFSYNYLDITHNYGVQTIE